MFNIFDMLPNMQEDYNNHLVHGYTYIHIYSIHGLVEKSNCSESQSESYTCSMRWSWEWMD